MELLPLRTNRHQSLRRRKAYPMKAKILLVGAVVLLACAAAYAADVTGKWVAEMPGRMGGAPTQTTFTFKVEGAKLTGSMQGAQGDPVEITEGKVEGDNISFITIRKRNDVEMKTTWKGKVSGDEIKFTREMQMPAGGFGGPGGGPGGGGPGPGGGQGAGQGGPPPGAGGGGAGGFGGPPPEIIAKRVK
jgi:hypothetical protein